MLCCVAIGIISLAGCADQPDADTDLETVLAQGEEAYTSYCAQCHGPDGQGNGTLAADLETPPPDLTRLALRNDGTFPTDYVISTIDGRNDVAAHSERQMPVWANVMEDEGNSPEEVQQMINTLTEYLRSIQVEETSTTSTPTN
jgi:mono/diheme cytochrome c family protein